jgi:hypothetical protein
MMSQNTNRHYLKNNRRLFQKIIKMKKEIESHAAMHGCACWLLPALIP